MLPRAPERGGGDGGVFRLGLFERVNHPGLGIISFPDKGGGMDLSKHGVCGITLTEQ